MSKGKIKFILMVRKSVLSKIFMHKAMVSFIGCLKMGK